MLFSSRGLANKRASIGLAFQLKETSLSQVKEELSGISRETDSYPTPNNEPNADEHIEELSVHKGDNDIRLTEFIDRTNIVKEIITSMEETKV